MQRFRQQPGAVLMIRPRGFGFNDETAASNAFQQPSDEYRNIQIKAVEEFDRMVDLLASHDIAVHVVEDIAVPPKPDAIFPNNWISFQPDGKVVLYPMMAANRRIERRTDIIEQLKSAYAITDIIDMSAHESEGQFLEGTGSLVFDHVNRIVYAALSPRTNAELVRDLAIKINYKPIVFHAIDEKGKPIYHTNVMMCVGEKFAMLCLDSINKEEEQDLILDSLATTGHRVIAISFEQMKAFAGNMMEVISQKGEPVVLMSQTAFHALLPGQINAISEFAELLPININSIEKVGGGSVRCMVAGIHLPQIKAN